MNQQSGVMDNWDFLTHPDSKKHLRPLQGLETLGLGKDLYRYGGNAQNFHKKVEGT